MDKEGRRKVRGGGAGERNGGGGMDYRKGGMGREGGIGMGGVERTKRMRKGRGMEG